MYISGLVKNDLDDKIEIILKWYIESEIFADEDIIVKDLRGIFGEHSQGNIVNHLIISHIESSEKL